MDIWFFINFYVAWWLWSHNLYDKSPYYNHSHISQIANITESYEVNSEYEHYC